MPRHSQAGGFTLIEAMIAMAVLLIGALGLMGMFTHGVRLNGDARRLLRAGTIAEDLINTVQTRPYGDAVTQALLDNALKANDADIADTQLKFTTSADPVADGLADHDETTLDGLGAAWTGIPKGELGDYERYGNVAILDATGHNSIDSVQIAAIVRWRYGQGYRRVVMHSGVLNPGRN